MLHGYLAVRQGDTGTALRVRNQQCPCFVDAIAPLGDIVTVQTATGLVVSILLDQLTGTTHGFLAVLPSMIEIRDVQTNSNQGCHHTCCGSFQQMAIVFLTDSFNHVSNDQSCNDEQVIIGHLHVVRIDLKSCEDSRHNQSRQIFASIG